LPLIDKEILEKIVHPDTLKAYVDVGETYRPETFEKTRYIFFERTGILTDRYGKKINEIERVVNAIYRVRNTKERRSPTNKQEFLLYNLHDYLDDINGNKISWSKELEGMHKVPAFRQDYAQDNKLHVSGVSSVKWFYDIKFSKQAADKLLKQQKLDAAGAKLYIGFVEDGNIKDRIGELTYEEFTREDFDDIYKELLSRKVQQEVIVRQPSNQNRLPWQQQQQALEPKQPQPQE
jgi:hypothetical protein